MTYDLFISCPRNVEYLLDDELRGFGFVTKKVSPSGVYGTADLKTLYHLCLWSRLANRVQWVLFSGDASDEHAFYQLCRQYDWPALLSKDNTFVVDFYGQAAYINNTMYGAQRLKDAIVDSFMSLGQRPSVDKRNPDVRFHAHLKNNILTVSVDLLGYSLHQRGYRIAAGDAPLKENIAAAMLVRAGWESLLAKGYDFVDPFCGSGTLLIEAAMMATQTAPGLLNHHHAFHSWPDHNAALWQQCVDEAKAKQQPLTCRLFGFDTDPRVIDVAKANMANIGFAEEITLKQQAIKDFQPLLAPALIASNPPYGERLSDAKSVLACYQALGQALYHHCQGSKAAILTSEPSLAYAIGLKVAKRYHLYNGPLPVGLYCMTIDADNQLKGETQERLNPRMAALKNRLEKNQKHLNRWLKRTGHTCYRLYHADLPDYAFIIDVYGDWAHVQEYAPPKEIPEAKAQKRVAEMQHVLPKVLDLPPAHIVLKQRKRQKGATQYQAMAKKGHNLIVTEGRAKYTVNLFDYLDTGLFLDHRVLRLRFSQTLKQKRFLNCFCYTGTVSVQAALAGAMTWNVDLSNTYLTWAKDNFHLNKLDPNQHHFIQADCLQWLKDCAQRFDVIFLDPPSFSNSKRMQTTLDIQRDQVELVTLAMRCLAPEGRLYFSNNLRHFRLSVEIQEKFQTRDITAQTLDEDFKGGKKSHQCFEICHR